MVNIASIQNKIQTKVFDGLGSTLSRSAYSQSSIDAWGDESASYAAASSITAVPWAHIKGRLDYQPFGDLQEGEVDMAFKYDQALNIKDVLYSAVLSQSYFITQIEEFPLADSLIVKIARLKKIHG